MVSKQVKWAAEMFHRALPIKGFIAEFPNGERRRVLWIRGLHYFISSNLPSEERQMPSRNGTRQYENTRNDYKRLSQLIVQARLFGLINDGLVWDNRNEAMIEAPSRSKITVERYNKSVYSGYDFTMDISDIRTFEEFEESIDIYPSYTENRFANQIYEIVIVTEKLTVKEIIRDVCRKYGTNLIVVQGQSSFTRVEDACRKAKKNKRPILMLGIYDLDCAGWDMPNSFMNRIQEKYPHPHHKFVRVALNRENVDEYGLPITFMPDEKGYSEKQKERFYDESGGESCIELDAMDNDVIRDLLEEQLKIYTRLKLDRIQARRFEKKVEREISPVIENFDISDHEEKYNHIKEMYDKFYEKTSKLQEYLQAEYDYIIDRMDSLENIIFDELDQELREVIGGDK